MFFGSFWHCRSDVPCMVWWNIFFVIPLTLISPSFSSVWTIGPTRTTTSIDPDEASAHNRDKPCQQQHSVAIDGAPIWLKSDHSGTPFTPVDFLIFFSFLLPPIWESTFTFIHIEFFLFYLCLFLMREFWVFTIEIVSLRDAWGHAIFSIGGDIVTYCNNTISPFPFLPVPLSLLRFPPSCNLISFPISF